MASELGKSFTGGQDMSKQEARGGNEGGEGAGDWAGEYSLGTPTQSNAGGQMAPAPVADITTHGEKLCVVNLPWLNFLQLSFLGGWGLRL